MWQWMVSWCQRQLRSLGSLLPSSPLPGAMLTRPAHGRKNLPPTVQEEREEGIVRIAHGEPHDPCPVPGCRGTLLFLHR
jgi:hypothetical protein